VTERTRFVSDTSPKTQLVAIGCSAGGIEALSTLLSTLRTPFPAPIVIAQHLDPNRLSHLAEVLSRRSTLPIRTVMERDTLEPGVVYVVPAGRNVEVSSDNIYLTAEDGERPKPSVDVLLRTAAEAYGENLIAVILTGTGSDGTAGACYVKKCGGTMVIENPATASFPGMPESLASNTVDMVADLDRIGPLLYDLVTGAYVEPPPDEEKRLQDLLDLVRERSGIDFKKYKQATILRRLRRRIVATDTEQTDGYIEYLADHPEEYQRLINSFLIKVTEFMRDPDLFAYLREEILPELIEHARGDNKSLRIWSAGCATGEEAYSLAILVSEVLGDELDDFNVRIFSTDLDSDAIAFARRGCYSASALADLPADFVDRYFVEVDGHFEIKKRLRNLTVFGEHDLGQRAPFPRLDLVVCRNVLIYFTGELQRRTLQLFAFSLREKGYLVLGKAETTSPLGEFFVPHELHHKVYLRRGERAVIPPTRVSPPPRRPFRGRIIPMSPRLQKDPPRIRMPIDALLLSLPFGAVLVDHRYDVLEINFAARRLLGVHGPAVGQDFVHLAQAAPHRELLDALDAALRGETPAPIELAVDSIPPGAPRHIQIACHAQYADPEGPKNGCALVLIRDVSADVKQRHELRALSAAKTEAESALEKLAALRDLEKAQGSAENERLRRENEERRAALQRAEEAAKENEAKLAQLTEVNQRLLRANDELTAAHEHLRGINEELMVSSEEAQAAAEEVETLNEEFQATNEELETVNEELQSTIEELNTTNADLEARSREVRELAAPIEAERARLSAILRSMGDGLLVVDGAGRPLLTNDAYQKMFAGSFMILSDEKGVPLPPRETPEQRAARGEQFQMAFTAPGADGSTRHFEAIGHPIGAFSSTSPEGGVIVIRDITERSIRKLQDRFLAMASHELRTPLVPLQGYLDMLLAVLPTQDGSERLHRFASLARVQAERLEVLVDDLVSATRIQAGKFQLKLEPVELGPLLTNTAELARAAPEHPPVHLDGGLLATESLWVRGDAVRLEQVMMNLLNNAFRYASGSPQIHLRLRRAGDRAQIEVQDYGSGIPSADLPHLFSSFYQVERVDRSSLGGMGLGLYICKEIIKAHGGEITVESAEGVGATFIIRLPLIRSPEWDG
jgi:two-component system CheB/CheR fusion protein